MGGWLVVSLSYSDGPFFPGLFCTMCELLIDCREDVTSNLQSPFVYGLVSTVYVVILDNHKHLL